MATGFEDYGGSLTFPLTVGQGGTGITGAVVNGVVLGSTASALKVTAAGSADDVFRVPHAGGAPAFGGRAVGDGKVRYADQFAGADVGAQMAAAIADLPADGGTVDARGLEGAQTISTDFGAGVSKPVRILWGAATFTVYTSLTVPAGMDWLGLGMDVTIFSFQAPYQGLLGGGKWVNQTFRDFQINLTGNPNALVNLMDAQYGATRCLFQNLKLVTSSHGQHGLMIRGATPGGVYNDNCYGNLFLNIRSSTADSNAPGVALYLYGQDLTGARANAHQVIGGSFDGFETGIFVHGQGNSIIAATFNGPAGTAALVIENGASGADSFDNLVEGCYFDSAITGAKLKLLDNQAGANIFYIAAIHTCVGLTDARNVTVSETVAGNIRFTFVGREIVVGGTLPTTTGSEDGDMIRSRRDDSLMQVHAGDDSQGGSLLLSGITFGGGSLGVSNHGGVSIAIYNDAAAEFRVVRRAGATYTALLKLNSSGQVYGPASYGSANVSTGGISGNYTPDLAVAEGYNLTITGDVAMQSPAHAQTGDMLYIRINQDAVGSHVVTWSTAAGGYNQVWFDGGNNPNTWSTIVFRFISGVWMQMGPQKLYS